MLTSIVETSELLRKRKAVSRGVDEGLPGADRKAQPHAECLHHSHRRVGSDPGAQPQKLKSCAEIGAGRCTESRWR